MKTIYKYILNFESDIIEIETPKASVPLCVHMQGRNICMWCSVLDTNPMVKRKFCIVGTGHPIPEGATVYIGSVFPHPFVFHIYIYEG